MNAGSISNLTVENISSQSRGQLMAGRGCSPASAAVLLRLCTSDRVEHLEQDPLKSQYVVIYG